MTEVPATILALLRRLEAEGGTAWLSTFHGRVARPDVHPSTLRTARQRKLVSEVDRRGPPRPAVRVMLLERGRAALEAAASG